MKVTIAKALLPVLMMACVETGSALAADPVITPTNRVELFNGKDFAGWAFCLRSNAIPAQTWSVTNGVMHCTGQPYGYARTGAAYRDYKLTVEWRFVKVAPKADNSGVFVHLQSPDNVWPRCIECQGQYRHQGDLIMLGGATCKDHLTTETRKVLMREPANEKPPGEWNTYEITCEGNTLKVFVNGRLMNEAAECSVSSGFIAIQSEGGELEVRKIFLEPLERS